MINDFTKFPDPLGYYQVGNMKFYSKLEAIEMQEKTGIHLHWNFNEDVFSSYDWKTEPSAPILELYRQRAQQLRDKYDYIILNFSGGADSTTILESFVNNDIKIDELVSQINYDANGDKNAWLNSEIFVTTIPYVERLKERHPWIKHRLVDLTQLELDHFNQNKNKFDWIYQVNMAYSPNAASRESFGLKIKEWADMIHAGKKVCMLWGIDKPRISQIDGKFVFRFMDLIDVATTVKSIAGQQPYTDELFYWTPDNPEMVIKQAHLIKNYLNGDVTKLPYVSTVKSDLAYREVNGVKYWLDSHGLHSLIYPNWNSNTFVCPKPTSIILTTRDTWFFEMQEHHNIRKNWKVGLDKLWQVLPDYWKNDPNNIGNGIKLSWSKDYFLE